MPLLRCSFSSPPVTRSRAARPAAHRGARAPPPRDGAVARHTGLSDRGGFLDILTDFIVYASLPIGLVAGSASNEPYLALAFMLASFYVNSASWMYLAAILEKRAARHPKTQTTVVMPTGLIGGFETIIAYGIFIAMLAILKERQDRSQLFVLSLPVSPAQYSRAKVWAALIAFFAPWSLLTLFVVPGATVTSELSQFPFFLQAMTDGAARTLLDSGNRALRDRAMGTPRARGRCHARFHRPV